MILTLENNISWWNDDAMESIRKCVVNNNIKIDNLSANSSRELVPFKVSQERNDGFLGGEMRLSLNPCGESCVTWFEKAELEKIQVNCAQMLTTWKNDEHKALYQVIIKQKQKLVALKEQTSQMDLAVYRK